MICLKIRSAPTVLFACALSASLTGCALTTTAAPDLVAGTAIAGKVHGGQQPVTGGRIYLLAANPAGYGSSSLSLLTAASTGNGVDTVGAYVTSNSVGQFTITGDYSCTTGYTQGASTASGGTSLPGNEQLYLYALGGNPGLGSGTNSSIGLLAALGPCNALYSQAVQVNEITTVAAAYALAGFAADATHVSSSGSALASTGLTNAGLNSQNLADVTAGYPPSTTAGRNGYVPTNNILTIANILSACINGASGNSSCSTLFQYTRSAGASGNAATDTASAAINLAHNPYPTAAGMTALYGLVTASPAFAGGLTSQPNDFTLGITYSGGGFANSSGNGIAIDAAGNVWATSGGRLCKFASTGTAISPASGYTGGGLSGKSIAIDTLGNVWSANLGTNTLSEFSNNGAAISGSSGYSGSGGGISTPLGIAIDASNSVWVANQSGTLSKFSSSGTPISGSNGYSDNGPQVAFYGVAIDASGNAWAANYNNSSVSKFASNGTPISPTTGYYGAGQANSYAVAIDGAGDVWIADYYSSALSEVSNSGAAISSTTGYRGSGVSTPTAVAIDSAGKVWSANFNSNSIGAFSNAGVALGPGSTGYNAGNGTYGPVAIAIDGSGDVWVTDYNGSLTQLIGAGSPVVTPLVANLVSPYGTSTVNRP